jgi:hypothetical protein
MSSSNRINRVSRSNEERAPAQLPLYISDEPPPDWKPVPKTVEESRRGYAVIIGGDDDDQPSHGERGVVIYQM